MPSCIRRDDAVFLGKKINLIFKKAVVFSVAEQQYQRSAEALFRIMQIYRHDDHPLTLMWRFIASKVSLLMTCSILQASAAAVSALTPIFLSISESTV